MLVHAVSRSSLLSTAVLTVSLLFLPQVPFAADTWDGADISIGETIVQRDVELIGANLTTIAGGTNFAINNHVRLSGYEPMMLRKFVRVDRAGANWFEWDQEGGPGYWNLAWTGLLDGATIRFYRIVDGSDNPLSYSGGSSMADISGADHVVFLGETVIPQGGYIANTDADGDSSDDMQRVYIENNSLGLRYGDYAYIKLKTTSISKETSPPDLNSNFLGIKAAFGASWGGDWEPSLVAHPGTLPDAFSDHGETCLKIDFSTSTATSLGEWVYHPYDQAEGQWYSQLHPGASYRVSVWMRQEGMGDSGKVTFRFSSGVYADKIAPKQWTVNSEWKHYTYDFIAPEYPSSGAHIAHMLEFTGPGTVWMDNFVLYRNDEAHEYRPFTPHINSLGEMLSSVPGEGKKPAMRFYGTIFEPSSIEAMFTNHGNPAYNVAWNAGIGREPSTTIAQALYWAYKTGDTPETRMVPILTCNEEYTEDEWMALVEFLGVPYDPAQDTPEDKPYAYLRYIFRGNDSHPWTDDFREIIIEYGNETWHNGAGGYGWHGWGQPGHVHEGGVEYGLFARYMFDDHVKKMPEWEKYGLSEKISFALGGNYSGNSDSYVEAALQQVTGFKYAGHANYVGPKWETNDTGKSVFDDHGVQMTLLGLHQNMKDLIEETAQTRDQLNDSGATSYKIFAYEGGPSGYWTNTGDDAEIDELYGKSVAMGLAALDTWLYSSLYGYTYQDYLGFSSGKWWTSHTLPEAGGFRAHPGWLALKMRNICVIGEDMVETTVNAAPTINTDGEDIPLVSSYAFTDGNSYSVFVLNRKLDGVHDGVDMGDGYTPVTLHLPLESVSTIRRYRLESPDGTPVDPRANNRLAENVVLGVQEIDKSYYAKDFVIDQDRGGEAGGLAPGSISLFVFERKNANWLLYLPGIIGDRDAVLQ